MYFKRKIVTIEIKIRENNINIGGTVVFLPFGGAVVYHGGFVVIGGYVGAVKVKQVNYHIIIQYTIYVVRIYK